jgi:hypothetical protein
MSPPSCFSSLRVNSAPTICPTARICAMNHRESRW